LNWTIEFHPDAVYELSKFAKVQQKRILRFLRERVEPSDNPRSHGAALKGPFRELSKYRADDYRIICDIQDQKVIILVVRIGHRREVYNR